MTQNPLHNLSIDGALNCIKDFNEIYEEKLKVELLKKFSGNYYKPNISYFLLRKIEMFDGHNIRELLFKGIIYPEFDVPYYRMTLDGVRIKEEFGQFSLSTKSGASVFLKHKTHNFSVLFEDILNPLSFNEQSLDDFTKLLDKAETKYGIVVTSSIDRNVKLPADYRINVIYGDVLVDLMIKANLGVTPCITIKKIDSSFFTEY